MRLEKRRYGLVCKDSRRGLVRIGHSRHGIVKTGHIAAGSVHPSLLERSKSRKLNTRDRL